MYSSQKEARYKKLFHCDYYPFHSSITHSLAQPAFHTQPVQSWLHPPDGLPLRLPHFTVPQRAWVGCVSHQIWDRRVRLCVLMYSNMGQTMLLHQLESGKSTLHIVELKSS
jgi:hypothetical protein